MQHRLSYHDLWELFIGTMPKPNTVTNVYKQKNKNALLLLTFALEDDLLPCILNITIVIDV
jgi:hypothetical protein